jgi:hypothetical protein
VLPQRELEAALPQERRVPQAQLPVQVLPARRRALVPASRRKRPRTSKGSPLQAG